jgi:hypothetical protein
MATAVTVALLCGGLRLLRAWSQEKQRAERTRQQNAIALAERLLASCPTPVYTPLAAIINKPTYYPPPGPCPGPGWVLVCCFNHEEWRRESDLRESDLPQPPMCDPLDVDDLLVPDIADSDLIRVEEVEETVYSR